MPPDAIHVLLIEDNPGDAKLVSELLSEVKTVSFKVETAGRLSEGLARLEQGGIDVVLLDLSLPDSRGLETLEKMLGGWPGAPIVVMTGMDDEETAIQAVQRGAQDYLVKGSADSQAVARAIRYAIERKRAKMQVERLSRQRELILHSAGDGICGLRENGTILFANPAAGSLLGCGASDLAGRSLHETVHRPPKDGPFHAAADCPIYASLMRGAAQHSSEDTFWRVDGARFPVEFVTSPMFEEGRLVGVVVTFRDISERYRAEKELLRLASFPRQTPNPIVEIKPNGAFTYVNPAALSHFPDILRAGAHHPILMEARPAVGLLSSGGEQVVVRELKYGARVYEMHVSYVAESAAVRIYMTDVTERKRLEELKNDFISTVSHELRTPLTIIQGAVSNLRDGILGPLTGDQQALTETTSRNCDRLARIINEILDLSRLESGKAKMNRVQLNVVPLAREMLRNFERLARGKGVRLEADLPDKLPPMYADSDMVAQVLTNLLSNALQYATKRVCLRARAQDQVVQVSVIDDGPGIPPEDRSKLFSKFQQLQRKVGGAGYKGTGLGLTICKEIVELHLGRIWVESVVAQGSQFHFAIPQYDAAFDFRATLGLALAEAQEKRSTFVVAVLAVENLPELRRKLSREASADLFRELEERVRKSALRPQDSLCRRQQNDFVAILRDAGANEAAEICGAIEKAVGTYSLPSRSGAVFPKIRVGVAVFPDDAADCEKLLAVALRGAGQGEEITGDRGEPDEPSRKESAA